MNTRTTLDVIKIRVPRLGWTGVVVTCPPLILFAYYLQTFAFTTRGKKHRARAGQIEILYVSSIYFSCTARRIVLQTLTMFLLFPSRMARLFARAFRYKNMNVM